MLRKLFVTDKGLSGTILRVLLGIVIFPHGAQKLLGWFGGGGFNASMRMFESNFNIPTIFALLAISVNMLVAVALVHWKVGFFMNWMGTGKGEGFEYHILAVAVGVALMIKGGGRWSVDGVIAKKLKR